MKKENVIQPSKLLKILNVKDEAEAEKILNCCFGFLIYLKEGQVLKTNTASFEKISNDLIHIDAKIDIKKTVKSLEKSKFIRIPI